VLLALPTTTTTEKQKGVSLQKQYCKECDSHRQKIFENNKTDHSSLTPTQSPMKKPSQTGQEAFSLSPMQVLSEIFRAHDLTFGVAEQAGSETRRVPTQTASEREAELKTQFWPD